MLFALVGGFNTALGVTLTTMWLTVLPAGAPAGVAVVLAYCISIVVAFAAHRTLVFGSAGPVWHDFARFVLVNCGALVANVALLQAAVSILDFPARPAAVVVMTFVAAASFMGHRWYTFAQPRPRLDPMPGEPAVDPSGSVCAEESSDLAFHRYEPPTV